VGETRLKASMFRAVAAAGARLEAPTWAAGAGTVGVAGGCGAALVTPRHKRRPINIAGERLWCFMPVYSWCVCMP
jgi:hypothetical protein